MKPLILFFLLTVGLPVSGQSFTSTYRIPLENDLDASGGYGVDNPYFKAYKIVPGVKVFENVDGLSQPLWLSMPIGKELVNAENTESQFRLAAFTNLTWPKLQLDSVLAAVEGANNLLLSEEGLTLGLYPYWILNRREKNAPGERDAFYLTLQTEISGRYNQVINKQENETTDLFQFRGGVSVDMGLLLKSNNFLTLNVATVYSTLSRDKLRRVTKDEFSPLIFEFSLLLPVQLFEEKLLLIGAEAFVSPKSEPGFGVGILVPIEK